MADATYTVKEDYYEDLIGGNGRKLIFRAGQQIAWEAAYNVGLVETRRPPKEDAAPSPALSLEPDAPARKRG